MILHKKLLCFLILLSYSSLSFGQQTVGLFMNSQDAYDGYTLFNPLSAEETYLIDNCGEKVHSWTTNSRPGMMGYLLDNGNLLRTARANSPMFNAGGAGGIIEIYDWDSNLIWSDTLVDSTQCQHHDIEYLPNGNILAIVWDVYSSAEATQAGRTTVGNSLWAEKIVEIQPDLVNGGGTIVWEWRAWDHLVQDIDSTLDNYGNVAQSPELIDINYVTNTPTTADWLHFNGIDYNPTLDQIVLSCHHLNEIWIIDHSTTTQEANGHTGGNAGKGGDLLYRWGNPLAYRQGTASDQKLFKQHDARWIYEGTVDNGMISVFNNQSGDVDSMAYSTIDVIDPPVNIDGTYAYTTGTSFAPSDYHWRYKATVATDFYSQRISGAHRLPNNNTLICEGSSGRLFEVDYNGDIVWEYVNPVSQGAAINQEDDPLSNAVFKVERYSSNYAAFTGKDLTPQGYIEIGSTFTCDLFVNTGVDAISNSVEATWSLYPNPVPNELIIDTETALETVLIYDQMGRKVAVYHLDTNTGTMSLNLNQVPNGMYWVYMTTADGQSFADQIKVQR